MSMSIGMGRRSVGPTGVRSRRRIGPVRPGSVPPVDWTRHSIAAVALLALVGAAALWAGGQSGQAGVAARVGAVFGAVWLAWPSLSRTSPRTWLFTGAALLVVLWRPRAAWIVLPALAFALFVGRGRRRRR